MNIVYFTHSIESCWNHGNAHFVRGVLRALQARGHRVKACERQGAWSRSNLVADAGEGGLDGFRRAYPDLSVRKYAGVADVEELVDDADVVIVHEWNEPQLVAEIGQLRKRGSGFLSLFHDTHHRAVSEPQSIRTFDLTGFDGVLAFGETLADVYRRWGWGRRVFVWHEAADVSHFRPPAVERLRKGAIWIGNWGDDERSQELREFLLQPARDVGLSLDIHGVRYPPHALAMLQTYGARFQGWIANADAPKAFAQHLCTVHVPRRYYVQHLPGIPTIRVFEALACGIPLVSAPWSDTENLFTPGEDFLVAESKAAMTRALRALMMDNELRNALAAHGLSTIKKRHTCEHRADELLSILDQMRQTSPDHTKRGASAA
jgi:spore maturation protein CgeB